MNETQRIAWWLALCRSNLWLQQFGQSADAASFDGRTGCGFTVLQTLALGWLGRRYTHNEIARMVGYPTPTQMLRQTGLVVAQVQTFIRKSGLPYVVVPATNTAREWTYGEIMRRANTMGPVAVALRYGDQPEWMGYRYRGVLADGKPNGYASPQRKAGKTQLTGFENGSHLDLLLGYHVRLGRDRKTVIGRVFHIKDPNHGSIPRPERPPFDDIAEPQFKRLYESPRKIGRRLYAIVPTRAFNR